MTASNHKIISGNTIPKNLPQYTAKVATGFASPADDHLDNRIDLNQLLITRPSATFMLKVEGDAMIEAGIHDGDLLIVDRSETAVNGSIVIAGVHDELTIKRLQKNAQGAWLMPENSQHNPLPLGEGSDYFIWGCVKYAIHHY